MESKTTNNAIKEVRKLLNKVRNNLSREETQRIREKLYKKEAVYNFLKQKEQNRSLTSKQESVLRNVEGTLRISVRTLTIQKNILKSINMAQITYLMSITKKTIPQIMFLKRLESFSMKVEVILYLKKQRELEKNSIKRKLSTTF